MKEHKLLILVVLFLTVFTSWVYTVSFLKPKTNQLKPDQAEVDKFKEKLDSIKHFCEFNKLDKSIIEKAIPLFVSKKDFVIFAKGKNTNLVVLDGQNLIYGVYRDFKSAEDFFKEKGIQIISE